MYIIIIIIRIIIGVVIMGFLKSASLWSFPEIYETSSFLKSPELFLVYWPILTKL